MLTKEKLMLLMADLESETVERTRAFDKADKMGQAICAFANDLPGHGVPGYLLLGASPVESSFWTPPALTSSHVGATRENV